MRIGKAYTNRRLSRQGIQQMLFTARFWFCLAQLTLSCFLPCVPETKGMKLDGKGGYNTKLNFQIFGHDKMQSNESNKHFCFKSLQALKSAS
jgi:hypothetical protein